MLLFNSPYRCSLLLFLILCFFLNPVYATGGGTGGGGTNDMFQALRLSLININPLAITNDGITPQHELKFCQVVPTESLDRNTQIPEMINCGTYTFDLKNFPANNQPSGGTGNPIRISPSEMTIVYLKLNNYQGSGTITMNWYRGDGTKIYTISTAPQECGGNCNWNWWYWYLWSFTGHFDWEINLPGEYYAIIDTSWGSSRIDFTVIDSATPNNEASINKAYFITGSNPAIKVTNYANINSNQNLDVELSLTFAKTGTYKIEVLISAAGTDITKTLTGLAIKSLDNYIIAVSGLSPPLAAGQYKIKKVSVFNSAGALAGVGEADYGYITVLAPTPTPTPTLIPTATPTITPTPTKIPLPTTISPQVNNFLTDLFTWLKTIFSGLI